MTGVGWWGDEAAVKGRKHFPQRWLKPLEKFWKWCKTYPLLLPQPKTSTLISNWLWLPLVEHGFTGASVSSVLVKVGFGSTRAVLWQSCRYWPRVISWCVQQIMKTVWVSRLCYRYSSGPLFIWSLKCHPGLVFFFLRVLVVEKKAPKGKMANLEMTSPITCLRKAKLYTQQYFQVIKLLQKEGILWVSEHLWKDCKESREVFKLLWLTVSHRCNHVTSLYERVSIWGMV